MPMVEIGLFALAIVFGVWLVAPKAWSSARRLSPDMNLLMVVAVAGAIGLGEYFEAATVAFFFSLSLYLESWSVGRARNAICAAATHHVGEFVRHQPPPRIRLGLVAAGCKHDVITAGEGTRRE